MRSEVRVDHRIEIRVVHAQEQAVFRNAGVVDEHVEPAVRFRDSFDGFRELGGIGNIADDCFGRSFAGANFADDLIELLGAARDGNDVKAVLRQSAHDRLADSSGASGDECDAFVGHAIFCFSDSALESDSTGNRLLIFLSNPVSTRPGASSIHRASPCETSACIVCSHRRA